MNTTPFEFNRDLFASKFRELPFAKQQLLRQIAANQLKNYSFEEIGSSDISNTIFSMWNHHCKCFDAILENDLIEY